jgi:hypothetical protein
MDISAWLRGLGLERYETAFRDNDVDSNELPELTADDLIGLGITSIGHRRKLLAAISALRTDERSAETAPVPSSAERRQLTVMFCDSGRLDGTGIAARSGKERSSTENSTQSRSSFHLPSSGNSKNNIAVSGGREQNVP